MTVLYIAGPMTRLKDFNRPAFRAAEVSLRAVGYDVLNPARQPDGLDRREYMRRGFTDVLAADGIAVLPGWSGSPGALCEVAIAEEIGTPQHPVDTWRKLTPKPSIEGAKTMDLIKHLDRQRDFSARTFGPGERRDGVLDHIAKEIEEVREAGALEEWVDLILLALDGAWRSGATSEEIAAAIEAKQTKNEKRSWPDWRTAEPGKAIEHHRGGTPGCGYCGRDNDNGTHDALVKTGHLRHDYDPAVEPGPEVSV